MFPAVLKYICSYIIFGSMYNYIFIIILYKLFYLSRTKIQFFGSKVKMTGSNSNVKMSGYGKHNLDYEIANRNDVASRWESSRLH